MFPQSIQIELFNWSLNDKVLGFHVLLLCEVLLASWLLEHIQLHTWEIAYEGLSNFGTWMPSVHSLTRWMGSSEYSLSFPTPLPHADAMDHGARSWPHSPSSTLPTPLQTLPERWRLFEVSSLTVEEKNTQNTERGASGKAWLAFPCSFLDDFTHNY